MRKLLALAFLLAAAPAALAVDNTLLVTPCASGCITTKSKDIGAGVQAPQPVLSDTGGNALATPTAGADTVSNTATGLQGYTYQFWFNGTTWDRARGDATNGAWVNIKGSAVGAVSGTSSTGVLGSMVNTSSTTNPTGATTGNQGYLNSTPTGELRAAIDAVASGGASTTGNIAANNTTAVVVKASAGTLYGVQVYGIGSAPAYLKIYNATSATCGSGTPVKRLMIPAAATAANGAGSNIAFYPGVAFPTGITYCVTTGIADADTTAPAASTFLVNLDWQ